MIIGDKVKAESRTKLSSLVFMVESKVGGDLREAPVTGSGLLSERGALDRPPEGIEGGEADGAKVDFGDTGEDIRHAVRGQDAPETAVVVLGHSKRVHGLKWSLNE